MKNARVTCTEHRRSDVAVVPGYTTTADRNESIGWLNFARNDGNEDNDDSRHSVPRRLSVTAQRIWWPRHRRNCRNCSGDVSSPHRYVNNSCRRRAYSRRWRGESGSDADGYRLSGNEIHAQRKPIGEVFHGLPVNRGIRSTVARLAGPQQPRGANTKLL